MTRRGSATRGMACVTVFALDDAILLPCSAGLTTVQRMRLVN